MMKNLSIVLAWIVFQFVFLPAIVFAQSSPAGYWQTYDLHHIPRSIIKISETSNGLIGEIQQVSPPQTANSICTQCRGKWKNAKLIGLPIIWGLKRQGSRWVNGRVLDVDSGKIYRCNISLSNNNKVMHFLAYVGVPLFGKTIDWKRTLY